MPNWKTYESSVRLLSAIVAAHPGLKLNYDDMSTYFGSDSTGGGIGFQFRAIKADAKRQRDCIEAGGDPRDLNIGGKVIAREYGDGVTEGTPKTPKTPKTATPRKRGPKAKKGASQDDGDDSEPQEFDTPSKKKATLNKVKGGRVTKTGRAKALSYAGQDMDEDEEEEDERRMVKMEDAPVSSNGDGFEDGNGYEDHGHQNGYAVIGADEHDEQDNFYNAAEDYGEA